MTHTLAYIAGIVILIAGIAISVALHELGHMIPAKRFGVKVPEYFIGFGPRVWSIRRGETEYGVKAIWLGGYVKLVGMIPPAKPGCEDKPGSMIAQARAESLAEIAPGEEHRAFYRLSTPRKLVVMAGGIMTNLVLGILLLAVALGVVGQPAYTSTIATVSTCVPADIDGVVSGTPSMQCASDPAPSAASLAGLQVGDRIERWDGRAVSTWAQVQEAIAASGTSSVEVLVIRDGEPVTLSVTPTLITRALYNSDGSQATDSDGQVRTKNAPYVGIGPALGTVRVAPGEVASQVVQLVGGTLRAIVTIPAGLYHAAAAGLGFEERNPQGLISLVGMGRIAGEVTSAGTGGGAGSQIPMSVRLYSMLSLLGSLNLALFAFNLIPLLPLDGGHVVGACWEGARRQYARMRRRPDPGYADTAKLLPVGQVVFYALIAMALLLIWVDVVAPI